MDIKEFNQTLHECLINSGFVLENKNYYIGINDLLVAVSTQKSNYDNTMFVDYAKSIN